MTGVLLNSGDLQKYQPLGDEGQPVYSVATQLREVIRARVGADAANCLAIPKVNETGSTVDWYAPQGGMVVPWSAATPEEQASAVASLDRFKQAVTTSLGAVSGVSGREQQIIQSLKDKVFTHPDNACVFLVNGEPVLTFWGFHVGEAPSPDPFYNLRPAPAVVADAPVAGAAGIGAGAATATTATTAAAVTTVARRPWWHWLLLALLLLLLLFLLLRACAPAGSINLPGFQGVAVSPTIDPPNAPAIERDPNVDVTVRERDLTQNRIDLTGQAVGDVNTVSPNRSGSIAVAPVDTEAAIAADGVETAEGGGESQAAIDSAQGMDPSIESPNDPTADPTAEPSTDPTVDQTLMPDPSADPSADRGAPDADQTAIPAVPVPDATAGAQPSGATPPLGQAMQIPSGAVQSGSVSFLDGRWRAAGGIQDANTGQPVKLFYDFKDGKGAVTVEKSGGIRCQSNASSQMTGGQLVISNDDGAAKCSDGTSMVLPTISCTPNASGQTDCAGVSSDGKPLPIMIRQSP